MLNTQAIFYAAVRHFQGNPTMAAKLVRAHEYLDARGLKPKVCVGPLPGPKPLPFTTATPRTTREAGL